MQDRPMETKDCASSRTGARPAGDIRRRAARMTAPDAAYARESEPWD